MHCNNAKQLSVLWGSFSICFSIFHFFCSFVKDVMRFDVNSGARVSTVNNSFGVCIVCNKHSSLRKRKIDFDWSPFTRRLVLLLFYVLCSSFRNSSTRSFPNGQDIHYFATSIRSINHPNYHFCLLASISSDTKWLQSAVNSKSF